MKKTGWKKAAAITMAFAMSISTAGCGKKKSDDSATEVSSVDSANVSDESTFDVDSDRVKEKTAEIQKYIDKYYYFEKDPAKQEEAYYDGLLEGLDDPYTYYYTKEEFDRMMEDDSGSYYGIGATVSKNMETGIISIVKPLKDSPALKAGLLPGDVLVEVNGTEVTQDMELESVVSIIRGPEGTEAKLKVYREGEKDYLDFTIIRAKIQNYTVEYEMLDGQIGYISVAQFITPTADEYKAAIDDLTSQGAKALIIDLRSNPGGYVDTALDMLDYLIDDNISIGDKKAGLLLETRGKDGSDQGTYYCDDGHQVDLPMAVLVNGQSASASEIFTGVMKDYGLAVIVGTNTFGKGIVQSVIRLSDGSGMQFTIAKYFTPAGNDIHEVGIAPDVEVDLPDEQKRKTEIPHDEDAQLQRAIKELTK